MIAPRSWWLVQGRGLRLSKQPGGSLAFVKLHDSMLDSSVWGLPDSVRVVWVTMLMMCDADGVVQASESGLARRAKVTPRKVRYAIEVLSAPDGESRDGSSGERIERVPGGWLVLNYSEYRDRQTKQQMQTAARVEKHRAKVRNARNAVTVRNATSPLEAEGESEGEGEQSLSPCGPLEGNSLSVPPTGTGFPSDGGGGKEGTEGQLYALLATTNLRSEAGSRRRAAVLRFARKFSEQGMHAGQLAELIRRARTNGDNVGALLVHWSADNRWRRELGLAPANCVMDAIQKITAKVSK